MAIDFDKEEIEKLPPSKRLAKIKELKAQLQKQLEEEATKLEENAKETFEEEQNELETLLQEHLAQERLEKERKSSELEETVRREVVEEQENKNIDYSTPNQSQDQYKPAPDLNNNQYTPGQNNSFDSNADNDPLSGKRDSLGRKSNSLYK